MDDAWACSTAYGYVVHLAPELRAWEYLRRNPRYLRDWMRHHRRASPRIAARWGLVALVDPHLDARQVMPEWILGTAWPVTLVKNERVNVGTVPEAAEVFSLWKLPGRKSLFGDGAADLRLTLRPGLQSVKLNVAEHLCTGDRFAYQIPAGAAALGAAFRTVADFHEHHTARSVGRQKLAERPGRTDLFHARALQVVDGLTAGASQRELAAAIFGQVTVARGWRPDDALRGQMRYLIRRARALVAGEYRSLIVIRPPHPVSRGTTKVAS